MSVGLGLMKGLSEGVCVVGGGRMLWRRETRRKRP